MSSETGIYVRVNCRSGINANRKLDRLWKFVHLQLFPFRCQTKRQILCFQTDVTCLTRKSTTMKMNEQSLKKDESRIQTLQKNRKTNGKRLSQRQIKYKKKKCFQVDSTFCPRSGVINETLSDYEANTRALIFRSFFIVYIEFNRGILLNVDVSNFNNVYITLCFGFEISLVTRLFALAERIFQRTKPWNWLNLLKLILKEHKRNIN